MTLRIKTQKATAVGAIGKAGRDQRCCGFCGEIATGFAGCSYNQIPRWCDR